MAIKKFVSFSTTPIARHNKKLKERGGALVLRAKKISFYVLMIYMAVLLLAAGMVLLEIGVPGMAWKV